MPFSSCLPFHQPFEFTHPIQGCLHITVKRNPDKKKNKNKKPLPTLKNPTLECLPQLLLASYSKNVVSSAFSATFPAPCSRFPNLTFSQWWHQSLHPCNKQAPCLWDNAKHVVVLGLLSCIQLCSCTVSDVSYLARLCSIHLQMPTPLFHYGTQLGEVALLQITESFTLKEKSVRIRPESNVQIESYYHLLHFRRYFLGSSSLRLNNLW